MCQADAAPRTRVAAPACRRCCCRRELYCCRSPAAAAAASVGAAAGQGGHGHPRAVSALQPTPDGAGCNRPPVLPGTVDLQDKAGMIIPVEITVYEDRSFTFVLKTPPASGACGQGRRDGACRGRCCAQQGGCCAAVRVCLQAACALCVAAGACAAAAAVSCCYDALPVGQHCHAGIAAGWGRRRYLAQHAAHLL